MSNKIVSIEEIFDVEHEGAFYDGYFVLTEENETHTVLIENGQSCCEDWGYFSTNDNLKEFLGLTLKDVDTNIDPEGGAYGATSTYFVNFRFEETSKVLQLAVYNSHNGYYGHEVLYMKNGKVVEGDCL